MCTVSLARALSLFHSGSLTNCKCTSSKVLTPACRVFILIASRRQVWRASRSGQRGGAVKMLTLFVR